MPSLKETLRKILQEKLKEKPIGVWYDKEGSFLDIVKKIRFKKAKLLCFDGSYLELRVKIEIEDPTLSGKWILYIPEAPPNPSWLKDYELIGEKLFLSLPQLYELIQGQPTLFDKDIKDLLKGKKGKLLVIRWDELLGSFKSLTKTKITEGLVITIFNLPSGIGPGRIITRLVEKEDIEEKLSEYGIEKEFCEYLEELGLKGINGNYVKKLSAALFLSEAFYYGRIEIDDFLEALPQRNYQRTWADWLREWLKAGNKNIIIKLAKEVEQAYQLKEKLSGWNIAEIKGLPCVDKILLEQIKPLTEKEDIFSHYNLIFDIARKRQDIPWKDAKETWSAILFLLRFYKKAKSVVDELKSKAFSLSEIYKYYKEDWWQVDRDYLKLEAVWKFLPEFIKNKIGKRASGIYREYLDTLGVKLAETIEKENTWWIKGWKKQNEIFSQFLKEKDIAIILIDALRFDLAKRLSKMIQDKAEVEEIPTQAFLPSITQIGMSALIPGEITIDAKKDGIFVKRAEKVVCDRASRIEVWRKLYPSLKVIAFENLEKEKLSNGPLLILSREIDLDKEEIRRLKVDTFEEILRQIAELITKLLELGYKVIVASDHGFLWLPKGQKPILLSVPKEGCKILDRRFAIGRFGDIEGAVKMPLSMFADGNGEILFPKGFSVFSKHGEISSFLHGGYLPQETALLSLVVRPRIQKYPLKLEIIGPDRIDTFIPIFTIQAKIDEVFCLPRKARLFIHDEEGREIANSEIIEFCKEERKKAKIRLERLGERIKIRLLDIATNEIIDQKELKVVLPAGYEGVEL